jgi:prepilin-type processing-associated H-X9-DG protein
VRQLSGTKRITLQVVFILLSALAAVTCAYLLKGTDYFDSTLITIWFGLMALCVGFIVGAVSLASNQNRAWLAVTLFTFAVTAFFVSAALLPNTLKESAYKTACLFNVRQLAIGMLQYAVDHDERFPPAEHWRELTKIKESHYDKGLEEIQWKSGSELKCPVAKVRWSYAMNAALSNIETRAVKSPENTVLLFEANGAVPNAVGGRESFVFRHAERGCVAFADGHSKSLTKEKAAQTKWKP